MKKSLKIIGISVVSILAVLYLSFLLILPNVVDLNKYKSLVQKLANEQAMLNVDFKNAKISTTPLLHAGVIIDGLSVSLPDNSSLISSEKIKARISLPHLLLLTVRVSTLEIVEPVLNLDIQNGEQFKVVRLIENIVNALDDSELSEFFFDYDTREAYCIELKDNTTRFMYWDSSVANFVDVTDEFKAWVEEYM